VGAHKEEGDEGELRTVGGGVAKNEGMKLFLWSCNAGRSLLVYGVRIVGVVQMGWLRLQHSELAACFAVIADTLLKGGRWPVVFSM